MGQIFFTNLTAGLIDKWTVVIRVKISNNIKKFVRKKMRFQMHKNNLISTNFLYFEYSKTIEFATRVLKSDSSHWMYHVSILITRTIRFKPFFFVDIITLQTEYIFYCFNAIIDYFNIGHSFFLSHLRMFCGVYAQLQWSFLSWSKNK